MILLIKTITVISLFLEDREQIFGSMSDIDTEGDSLLNDFPERFETISELKAVYNKYNHSFYKMKRRLLKDPLWSATVQNMV